MGQPWDPGTYDSGLSLHKDKIHLKSNIVGGLESTHSWQCREATWDTKHPAQSKPASAKLAAPRLPTLQGDGDEGVVWLHSNGKHPCQSGPV